jgi:methionine synthase II (cobalamin-independent)
MADTRFNCLPTIIGSMPHTDPEKACSLINHYLKDIPAWPQLPRSSFRENMSVQFSQGFPGIVDTDNNIYVDRSLDWNKPLEELYNAYLENNTDKYPIGADYAAGLYIFLSKANLKPKAVKGQITGPVSWGLSVTDDSKRAILYDDMLSDACAKLLCLKAGWQEKELAKISANTIIFIDEPSMASYGSAYFSIPKEKIISLLEEVLGGISGVKGIHCCGNTDWPIILRTSTDILSFDTYNYAESLTLYPDEVKQFIDRGGAIAWGIVPNSEDNLNRETVASLKDRLEEAMAPFTRAEISFRQLVEHGLLTPSCSLSLMSEQAADHTLELLVELSVKIRKHYT